jgi:hypothetical protein
MIRASQTNKPPSVARVIKAADMVRELTRIESELQSDTIESISDTVSWMDFAKRLVQYNAYAGECMAIFKRELLDKKATAYETFVFNVMAREKYEWLPASVIKDYINSKCAEQEYNYLLAERVCRACVHAIDVARSCISTLKEEMRTINYQ